MDSEPYTSPTNQEILAMLIQAVENQGGRAWWDGEVINADFGSAHVRITVNIGHEDLASLLGYKER